MAGVVAIVLVEPGTDVVSVAVDFATGRRGWSHVFIDPGWPSDGDPIVVDITRELGVQLSTWTRASGGRRTRRIELDHATGRCVLEALGKCLGRSYNRTAMVLQPLQRVAFRGTYCSTVIADCLPASLRELLPACPSPADLAKLEART
jgi:hypothetical protein